MIGTISNIVSQLTANGDTFTFEYGKRGYINVLEDNLLLPAVIYDTESIFNLNPIQSGFIGESGRPILSFMYKSELDWTPSQHHTHCILPAINAARQFISLCQDSNLIDEISVGDGREFINLLDKNTSGIQFPFDIKLNVDKTVCATANPSTNCQPVIFTINGVLAETILSGTSFEMLVTLNGVQSGVYNELTKTWEVVGGGGVCADATVNVNSNLYNTVVSGGTIDVLVQDEDENPVGTIINGVVVIPNIIPLEIDLTFDNIELATATTTPYNIDCTTPIDIVILTGTPDRDGTYIPFGVTGNDYTKYNEQSNPTWIIQYAAFSNDWLIFKPASPPIYSAFAFGIDKPYNATWSGGESVIKGTIHDYCADPVIPCSVGLIEINGVLRTNVASGGTRNILVEDTDGNAVGTWVGPDTVEIGDSQVENSDATYSLSIHAQSTGILEDETFNIYVNGVLNQTFTEPSMQDLDINISI